MRHVLADYRLGVCCQCGDQFFIDLRREGRRPTACSSVCAKRWAKLQWESSEAGKAARARERHVRRARKAGQPYEAFNPFEIYARDGWVCQICKRKIPKRVRYPDPRSPSLDHIVPLSQGGSHSRVNVQMVHLGCNTAKGVGGVDQLRLIG